ncbi:long-chain fatty acid transport protein [Reinekea marinisedimentorum]|uniref:Long-chain fatty acid transport protein n=2 Tax=Reinekea marinisedimentorum TaxID=230495 RepID=A0A4R3I9P5_9GAMM|nr:long-chain fatty acid transport protein [Reinekea marinisedimentorum]
MKLNKITLAIAAAGSLAATPYVTAAGFQVTNHSASGLGRANAGDAVIADNSSVIANNPAAIMLLDQWEISFGTNAVAPNTDVTDVTLNSALSLEDDEDVTNTSYVPYLYLVRPVNDQLSFGFSVYSDFGTNVEYDDEFNEQASGVTGLFAGYTKIWSINYSGTAGYRVNESLSIGGSVKALNGGGTFERPGPDAGAGESGVDFEGSGWTFGWDIGAVYELSEAHRFGLSYKSAMDLEVDAHGSSTFSTYHPTYGYLSYDIDNLDISLPSIAEFSGYHELNDRLAVHYSAMYIGWGVFEDLVFNLDSDTYTEYTKEYNWNDSWRFSLGSTYSLNEKITLRAGISYDESPISEDDRLFSIVDSNRMWYSTGATWQVNENASVDLGLTYLVGEEIEITESIDTDSDGTSDYTLEGTSETTAWLAGLQVNYKF